MKHIFSLHLILASALLAGCGTAPRDGSDKTTYYQSYGQAAAKIPSVTPAPVALRAMPGPTGVARIVYFDFDRSNIRPTDRPVVEAHATYLKRNPTSKVVLEGSTDLKGGREYNLALGQRRAESVRTSLVLIGVQDKQIEAISLGMEKPASSSRTPEGDQLNRRVEFQYR